MRLSSIEMSILNIVCVLTLLAATSTSFPAKNGPQGNALDSEGKADLKIDSPYGQADIKASSASTPVASNSTVANQTLPPLLPREVVGGNPDYSSVAMSSDGKYLSYLAPWNGVLNLYVRHFPDDPSPKRLTSDRIRGIGGYGWMIDNRTIIYGRDDDGDENWRLYAVDVETNETRILTNTSKVRAAILASSRSQPDVLIIGLNDRNASYHDAYILNVTTGDRKLIFKNDQFGGYLFDNDLKLRYLQKENDDAGSSYFTVSDDMKSWNLSRTFGPDEAQSTGISHFDDTGTILYWIDSVDRDKGALIKENLTSGERTVIYEPKKSDIGIFAHPITGEPLAVTENYLKPERIILDKSVEPDFRLLDKRFPNSRFSVSMASLDMSIWLVAVSSDNQSAQLFLYNRTVANESEAITYLLSYNTKLENYTLTTMHAVEVPVADGFMEVCYYILPLESDPNRTGIPDRPLPTILGVHGGPRSRVSWGLNTELQAWASRGYAIITCNFRGSTGYGKRFLVAGNKEWGKKMQQDLTDAVRWAVKKKISDPKRVAIMGGSYGGYATLAGMAFTPEVYACGVDIVGPSNLVTLLKSIPPYWKPQYETLKHLIGAGPDTPEGREFLQSISPLFSADKIRKPLLIAQGANDPRVKKNESDQIVEALKKNSVNVTYLVFPDEGHGFGRAPNRLAFFALAEQFLAKCLGGRAEPIGNALNGSTVQVQEIF